MGMFDFVPMVVNWVTDDAAPWVKKTAVGVFNAGPEATVKNELSEPIYVLTYCFLDKHLATFELVNKIFTGDAKGAAEGIAKKSLEHWAETALEEARAGRLSLQKVFDQLPSELKVQFFSRIWPSLPTMPADERAKLTPLLKDTATEVKPGKKAVVLSSPIIKNITSLRQTAVNGNPRSPIFALLAATASFDHLVAFPTGAKAAWAVNAAGGREIEDGNASYAWGSDSRASGT